MQVPVLTYHAVNIHSNDYDGNDHVAFAADLELIHRRGFRIMPLRRICAWHRGLVPDDEMRMAVGISFDDGTWFDYHDLDHPTCGPQRGMLGILRDFRDTHGAEAQPGLHATSFVIASPAARRELDVKGLVGKGWWGDEWWLTAEESGLVSVECHSWDHNHPDLDRVAQREQRKGSFRFIDNLDDCEAQIARAGAYIAGKLGGRSPELFAYPWGEYSDYLVGTYLPEHADRHRFRAAFTTDPRPVRKSDSRWLLPRYVFGRDWRDEAGLKALLA